jgi:L-lysine 2,3-aminomutase
MIAATPTSSQRITEPEEHESQWQRAFAAAITDPAELLDLLGLDPALLENATRAAARFGLRVPRGFVQRMRRGDPSDPLLRQILPLGEELDEIAGFHADPVGDLASRLASGVLYKYESRALLITTVACAVHCRYCFRREFPYADENLSAQAWRPALEALRSKPAITEVILSGGDPLSLSDRRLKYLVDGLLEIPQVQRLRIHTRQPVVLPERIDRQFIDWFAAIPLQRVVVIHANHARELDATVESACRNLAAAGATLLNQSVLLKGVNDAADTLIELSERLFAIGVLPYYLHLLDRVAGSAHFEVPAHLGAELVKDLMRVLPGYLVPRLVREVPGEPCKTPVNIA